uniref:piggyBac transposable element-derived protein 4-like n=1 Tax=Epinephelus lanceolatus TaxID=310571 RepID=UPI001445F9A0|nr:piggyBac transposable element-derived protein 4-like [Epinephelus lanceolatus]
MDLVLNGGGDGLELMLTSNSESGAESFLTDEEVVYQEGLDPAEDVDHQQQAGPPDTSVLPSTSSAVVAALPLSRRGQGKVNFALSSEEEEEEPSTSAVLQPSVGGPGRKRTPSATRRGRARSRGGCRSRSPLRPQSAASATSWKTEEHPDTAPDPKRFLPARTPGHQLSSTSMYTPLDLFKLFFTDDVVKTLCQNTNKQAAKNIVQGKKYSWTDITTQEFQKFLGLNFYFALVKMNAVQDYWKTGSIFSLTFPASVMPWNRYLDACKAHYHPYQNLAIDERMVATKAHTGMTQYMKAKPTKLGFKLFVLADSSNGYTVDFTVYTGKTQFPSGVGLAYDAVMSLIKPAYLGTGFHVYMDNFYTSPTLFRALYNVNMVACGTYRDNRKECPQTSENALHKKVPRGSIRWIRQGPLIFVKWMDTREVSVCSTIHRAFDGATVKRRMKSQDGSWITISVSCPTPVVEYNKHMGGVDLSDQLIQYYSVQHRSNRWYRTLFYHFMDIAATNSYLLHKDLCKQRQQEPMSHRGFLQELTAQLCGVTVNVPPQRAQGSHIPVPVSHVEDKGKKATAGRKKFILCRKDRQVQQSTPWKCEMCDVALCLVPDRNCFKEWHK